MAGASHRGKGMGLFTALPIVALLLALSKLSLFKLPLAASWSWVHSSQVPDQVATITADFQDTFRLCRRSDSKLS